MLDDFFNRQVFRNHDAAFDFLIGDYFLEIRRRLRENGLMVEEINLKELQKLQMSPTGPL
jgi:hypothetical protein